MPTGIDNHQLSFFKGNMSTETIPAYYFDSRKLQDFAATHRESFLNAEPFHHVVIDDFLPKEIADKLADEFPSIDQIDWTLWGAGDTKQTKNKNIEKVGTSDETKFGPFTRHVMLQFNSHIFLKFLESLTQIRDLVPDPSFNGCGLHSTGRGGRLMIHTDTNRHPIQGRMHQRLNMIYFLNRDWKEEYGGHFELWDRKVTRCVKKVLPVFNRFLVFDTGRYSFHGHATPLTCPPDRRRNSLAVYYYVLDRETDENYKGLQLQVGWVPTTVEDKLYYSQMRIKRILKKCVPPIWYEIVKLFKGQS